MESGEDAVANAFIGDEGGVEASDGEVGLGEAELYVADDVDEEREAARHGLEEREIGGLLLVANSPNPTHVATLHEWGTRSALISTQAKLGWGTRQRRNTGVLRFAQDDGSFY